MRKEFDYYPTPLSIVEQLGRRIGWGPCTFWEPCNGGGHLSNSLIHPLNIFVTLSIMPFILV